MIRTLSDTGRRRLSELGSSVWAPVERGRRAVDQAVSTATVLGRAGLLGPVRPDRLVGMGCALRRYGVSVSGAYAVQAARQPQRVALLDQLGALTFAEMDRRTTALAGGLATLGVGVSDRVGVLCRNHRGFIEATVALAQLGADTLYLNTGSAGPQIAEVLRCELASAIILDEEFAAVTPLLPPAWPRILTADSSGRGGGLATLDELAARASDLPRGRPARESRQILLTSGTTGAPRATQRQPPARVDPLLALLSAIPLRTSDTTLVAAPMFHTWGLAHLALGLVLGSTLVLRARFDPEATLALIEEHRVTAVAAVPVMLSRILELPEATRQRYNTSSLRVVAVSGSALPGDLAQRFMDAYGEVLYNLYGSTEVAWASIATPEDLRAAPGTAGRPPAGTVVRVVDDNHRPLGAGERGRIFVGNSMLFSGYTDGGTKEVIDGLMATGDTGFFDSAGRLFVVGRDDDMIVSGGENVFPGEVEDLLSRHPAVVECAVIGVADREFGQRLNAFVVIRAGHAVGADELKALVRERLARHSVPREVVFVDALPRNATGKIVRRALSD